MQTVTPSENLLMAHAVVMLSIQEGDPGVRQSSVCNPSLGPQGTNLHGDV